MSKETITLCPRCNMYMDRTTSNEYYWMCYHCIEGWTWEELLGIMKYKKILKELEQ